MPNRFPILIALLVGICGIHQLQAADGDSDKVSVTFEYSNSSAKAVYLVGEFNSWLDNENGKIKEKPEWLMKKDDNGNWKLTIQLAPGKYQYKLVVDGEWKQDPANQETSDDGYGGKNSVKIVSR